MTITFKEILTEQTKKPTPEELLGIIAWNKKPNKLSPSLIKKRGAFASFDGIYIMRKPSSFKLNAYYGFFEPGKFELNLTGYYQNGSDKIKVSKVWSFKDINSILSLISQYTKNTMTTPIEREYDKNKEYLQINK
jgi:hypothetical protein